MPVDTNVFNNVHTFLDYQRAQDEFEQRKAMQAANIAKQASGAELPAPLQLANEYQKRLQLGDTQGANLIMQFAKTQDKGLQVDASGQFAPLPGYAPAVATIDAAKAGAKEQAQSDVKLTMDPKITAATTGSKIAAETSTNAAIQLPQYVSQVEQQKGLIDTLLNSPGLHSSVGIRGLVPARAGSDSADFGVRLEQIKGKNFLEAFNQLRGAGAITEAEGTKATQAISRLDTFSSEPEFRKAAVELQGILDQGLQRAKQKANLPTDLNSLLASQPSQQGVEIPGAPSTGGWSAKRVK